MSWQTLLVAVLLIVGVGIELFCCLGILIIEDVYNRLHYLGLASLVGPIAIAAAILVQEDFSQAGVKAILIVIMLMVVNPILTHTTARAIYLREAAEQGSAAESEPKRR